MAQLMLRSQRADCLSLMGGSVVLLLVFRTKVPKVLVDCVLSFCTVDFMGFKQQSLRNYHNPSPHLGDRRPKRVLRVASDRDPRLLRYVRQPRRQQWMRSNSDPRLLKQALHEQELQMVNELMMLSEQHLMIKAEIDSLKDERQRVGQLWLQCIRDPRLRNQEYQRNFDRTRFEELLRRKSFVHPWQVELLRLQEKVDALTLTERLLGDELKTISEKSSNIMTMLFASACQYISF